LQKRPADGTPHSTFERGKLYVLNYPNTGTYENNNELKRFTRTIPSTRLSKVCLTNPLLPMVKRKYCMNPPGPE